MRCGFLDAPLSLTVAHRLAREYGGRPSAYLGITDPLEALLVDAGTEALGASLDAEAIGPALRSGHVQVVYPLRS